MAELRAEVSTPEHEEAPLNAVAIEGAAPAHAELYAALLAYAVYVVLFVLHVEAREAYWAAV